MYDALISIMTGTAIFLFILLLFWRLHLTQERLERKWFKVRIHPVSHRMGRLFLRSLLGGVLLSLLLSVLGLQIRQEEVWIILLLSLLFGLFRLSLLDVRAGMLLLLLLSYPVQMGIIGENIHIPAFILQFLQGVNLSSYLFFIAGLTLVEGFLLRMENLATMQPIQILGQRGKAIGGYLVQRIWPIPLALMIPAISGFHLPDGLLWWPLIPRQGEAGGFHILFLPLLIATNRLVIRSYPFDKIKRVAFARMGLGLLETGLAFLSLYVSYLALPIFLLLLLLFFILRRSRERREREGAPYFTNTYQGLSVLAVLPGSPAKEMGIEVGDRVTKANGIPVRDEPSFYAALQKNSAFCKLEVMNREGNLSFPQRSLYLGEHHLLGLIFAPGDQWHDRIPAPPQFLLQIFLPVQRKRRTIDLDSPSTEMQKRTIEG